MTFAHPLVLLLLAIPALMLWAIPMRGPGVVLPFDGHVTAPKGWRRLRARMLAGLLGLFECVPPLLLAAAIAILAGPQRLQAPKDARELTNIQFCLDVSGSMAVEDRYDMAKEAVEQFVLRREGDAFGLTLFGSRQIRWTPLTTDLTAIRGSLPFANPRRQPSHMGGTMIGAALRFCRDNMVEEAERGDRLIILISDGQSFDLQGDSAGEIGDELVEAGIVVYHVHVSNDPVPDEVVEITERTGGESFQASDPGSLERVFLHIDRMRPARYTSLSTVPMDWFTPFALVGAGLLAFHLVGLLGVRYTPW